MPVLVALNDFILVTGTTQPEHEVLQRQEQPISAALRTKQVSLL